MALPHGETLAVQGYRELLRALRDADRDTRFAVRATLRHAGDAVQSGAKTRLASEKPKDAKTEAGYKTIVRARGVSVEQTRRKTTGLHPEWGAYQMKHALVPALVANEAETERLMEAALDDVAARVNRTGERV